MNWVSNFPGAGWLGRRAVFCLGLAGGLALPSQAVDQTSLNAAASHPSSVMQAASNHWAFKAPARPALPKVQDTHWARNAIDRFVLARLEAEKLTPSPEADRVTLIRRVCLDLTGLPPSIQEVDAFLADQSPDAYEKLVERLLASPHYGEKWGRHWLDAARYADTNGYEKDLPRSIWPYRDWVIKAFNQDLPFNEFTIEQMAGDMLPNPTADQRVATGFHRNSMVNEEGGIDPEEFRVAAIINRVETTGKAFLGLTINCAQCHSHKYDPISQQEFYQFYAFLNNQDEPMLEVPSQELKARRQEIRARIREIEHEKVTQDPAILQRLAEWEQHMRALDVEWSVLEPSAYFGAVGTKFTELEDHSLLATGSSPPVSTYTISVKSALTNITAFRLETLTDPNLPLNGPGRAANGNFVLTSFEVEVVSPDGKMTNQVAFQGATADLSQNGFAVSNVVAVPSDNKKGWAVDGGPDRNNQERRAVFETREGVGFGPGSTLMFTLKQLYGQEHTIGRLRLSATTSPRHPIVADPLTTEVRRIITLAPENRTSDQQAAVLGFYRPLDSGFGDANQQIAKLKEQWGTADTTLVLSERKDPRPTKIFRRGDFRSPTDEVTADVPAFLPRLTEDEPGNRLGLARWLVDGRNPLTARVIVNRFWMAYFGRGIVPTAEDFGTQGDKPSHPELLDWLATEFVARGWSMKAMHRLMVESATYRQSSSVSSELYALDQYNRLLARGPRVRVDAEVVRDIALSASGLLSSKLGGPSVYPPIPDGVMGLAYGAPMKWETSKGEDRYRRGLYTFWKRTIPYPGLSVFDAPNADTACVRRVMSDTPLQALTTLNDTVFHEASQALAMRVWKEGGANDEDRAVYAFRLCTGRKPDANELGRLLELLKSEEHYFENRTTEAIIVASADPKNPPSNVNLHQVAAWTLASRVLLNLDETITKE